MQREASKREKGKKEKFSCQISLRVFFSLHQRHTIGNMENNKLYMTYLFRKKNIAMYLLHMLLYVNIIQYDSSDDQIL